MNKLKELTFQNWLQGTPIISTWPLKDSISALKSRYWLVKPQ